MATARLCALPRQPESSTGFRPRMGPQHLEDARRLCLAQLESLDVLFKRGA